jgi:hypothetical protein
MTLISSPENVKSFLIKWTPRALAVAIGGYYGLGIAYELGLMAVIDKIAIAIFKHSVGYVGIGAAMPTFQWYSAWAIRISIGLGVGGLYDLTERAAKNALSYLKSRFEPSPTPGTLTS